MGVIAIFTAFPAELQAVLEHAQVATVDDVHGHLVRRGTFAGEPAVLTMTGIGLVNATATSIAVFERYPVNGVVFVGVAGSSLRIADVAAPATWTNPDGNSFSADQDWLAIAHRLEAAVARSLERCTEVVIGGTTRRVCLAHQPQLVVGGAGHSSDPFDGPLACQPNGGDVFGCDALEAAHAAREQPPAWLIDDMETAAVVEQATVRRLPFIAFRAVSDGQGDPLGLPGFPNQFFAYYRLAARNAASAASTFVAAAR